MAKIFNKKFIFAVIVGLSLANSFVVSSSQAQEVKIPVPADKSTHKVIGITYSSSLNSSSTTGQVEQDERGTNYASFSVSAIDPLTANFTNTMLLSTEGETYFTNTFQIESPQTTPAELSLPLCQPSSALVSQTVSKRAAFESLIDARVRRRQNATNRIAELLTPDLLDRLDRLEKTFGFRYQAPLSKDTPSLELNHRVDQILHALRQFQFYREKS